MKKILPWFGGVVIGVILSVLALVGWMVRDSSSLDIVETDPTYRMVAVSWGGPMTRPESKIYQIQVVTADEDGDGSLEVSAIACRQGVFFYDIGRIGSASDMEEAIKEFGVITWQPKTVTVGGISGIRGTFERARIERHR